jgi:hypothetical protein
LTWIEEDLILFVVREDVMGNIFGKFEGSDATAGSVLTGSHCDAIPLAGEDLSKKNGHIVAVYCGPSLSIII